jgi:hypothetical protein
MDPHVALGAIVSDVDRGDEGEGWCRADWARWYLDHDDPAAAALELSAGDDLALDEASFPDLARALHAQGLAAIYEDGYAYVYTPDEAIRMLAEDERDAMASGARLPPARSPAPAWLPRPAIRAPRAPGAASASRARRPAG